MLDYFKENPIHALILVVLAVIIYTQFFQKENFTREQNGRLKWNYMYTQPTLGPIQYHRDPRPISSCDY